MRSEKKLLEEIEKVLDVLRDGIAMHGGGVEVVDLNAESGKVSLRLHGACVGCPMSEITFRAGIEESLMRIIPEIKEVTQVE